MSAPPAAREAILSLAPSRIREIANAGMGRPDLLAFWFGESDRATPPFIRRAATRALSDGRTFYTRNLGQPELRAAIADYLSTLHGVSIAPDRIAVTGSGVSAIMLAAQTVLSPGDRVAVVTPVWPNVAEIPRILGAEVVRVPLGIEKGRWRLDIEALLGLLTPDIRMLVINAPNNPTGWTLTRAEQAAILAHCRARGIWVMADEVYERLVHTGEKAAPSMLALAEPGDRVIGLNSFSKAWRMTGWRIGWLVLPEGLAPALETVIEYNTSCVPEFVQAGALAALTDPRGEKAVLALVAALKRSRKRLISGLRGIEGLELAEGDGAMYVFFRLAGQPDSMALARSLVAEAGLGLAPGLAFGPEGEGWLRWCVAADPERIAAGLDRLGRFLAR